MLSPPCTPRHSSEQETVKHTGNQTGRQADSKAVRQGRRGATVCGGRNHDDDGGGSDDDDDDGDSDDADADADDHGSGR